MNNSAFDMLTAEERAVFAADLGNIINDSDICVAVSYESAGTRQKDDFTGQITEVDAESYSVNAFRITPSSVKEAENEEAIIEDAFLVLKTDLDRAPKVGDRMQVPADDRKEQLIFCGATVDGSIIECGAGYVAGDVTALDYTITKYVVAFFPRFPWVHWCILTGNRSG